MKHYVPSPLWVFFYITSCIFLYNPITWFRIYGYPQIIGTNSEAGSLSNLSKVTELGGGSTSFLTLTGWLESVLCAEALSCVAGSHYVPKYLPVSLLLLIALFPQTSCPYWTIFSSQHFKLFLAVLFSPSHLSLFEANIHTRVCFIFTQKDAVPFWFLFFFFMSKCDFSLHLGSHCLLSASNILPIWCENNIYFRVFYISWIMKLNDF